MRTPRFRCLRHWTGNTSMRPCSRSPSGSVSMAIWRTRLRRFLASSAPGLAHRWVYALHGKCRAT